MEEVERARRPRRSRWLRTGLSPRQERVFNWLAFLVVLAPWSAPGPRRHCRPTIRGQRESAPPGPARAVGSSLLDPRTRTAPYLIRAAPGAAARPERQAPRRLPRARSARSAPGARRRARAPRTSRTRRATGAVPRASPRRPIPASTSWPWRWARPRRPVDDLRVITLVPFAEKKNGRIGLYYLGRWPYEEGGKPRVARLRQPVRLRRGHAREPGHRGVRALQARRLPDQGPVRRLAQIHAARRAAARQARAHDRGAARRGGHDVRHVHGDERLPHAALQRERRQHRRARRPEPAHVRRRRRRVRGQRPQRHHGRPQPRRPRGHARRPGDGRRGGPRGSALPGPGRRRRRVQGLLRPRAVHARGRARATARAGEEQGTGK